MTLAGNKAKGSKWESELTEHLRDRTGQNVRRLRLTGNEDIGDMHVDTRAGMVAVEAKNAAKKELAVWCTEAAKEAANAGLPHWAVVMRRKGQRDPGQAYVILTLDEWLAQTGATS